MPALIMSFLFLQDRISVTSLTSSLNSKSIAQRCSGFLGSIPQIFLGFIKGSNTPLSLLYFAKAAVCPAASQRTVFIRTNSPSGLKTPSSEEHQCRALSPQCRASRDRFLRRRTLNSYSPCASKPTAWAFRRAPKSLETNSHDSCFCLSAIERLK